MSYRFFPSYKPPKLSAEKVANTIKRLQNTKQISPIVIEGRIIAKRWWGKSWNKNLESYADFHNRIGRGKSYVKSGAVVDLAIAKGTIESLVVGSRKEPYAVTITIEVLAEKLINKIVKKCTKHVESIEDLAMGRFPKNLEESLTDRTFGLFPKSCDIHFNCSCPDSARMCKHVAATLYGVGKRLDEQPLLFFELRGIDSHALIKKTIADNIDILLLNAKRKTARALDAKDAARLFEL